MMLLTPLLEKKLFKLLREQGALFEKTTLQVTLDDGLQQGADILQTKVTFEIESRTTSTIAFALHQTKGNRILLGIDFLSKIGFALGIRK